MSDLDVMSGLIAVDRTKDVMEARLKALYKLRKNQISNNESSTKEQYEETQALEVALVPLRHEAGEDCEQYDCTDCCGEFHGHGFDSSEGGYCECGANGYESGAGDNYNDTRNDR